MSLKTGGILTQVVFRTCSTVYRYMCLLHQVPGSTSVLSDSFVVFFVFFVMSLKRREGGEKLKVGAGVRGVEVAMTSKYMQLSH